ncbi:MAG: acyl-CoA dehydrogenase, partial [Pseudomonas sp.]
MTWLQRLNDPQRFPLAASLADTYSGLLAHLGALSPFELAVLGARAMPTPGLAFLIGYQAALRVLWP